MTKIALFDADFTQVNSLKLSKTGNKNTHRNFITCRSLSRQCNLGTRRMLLGLSNSTTMLDRGLRKSSSLTNGIDLAHYSNLDTSKIQESMAKKARGLAFHSAPTTISTMSVQGQPVNSPL